VIYGMRSVAAAMLLTLMATPAIAQETDAPETDALDPASIELALEMPTNMGGFEPDVVIARGVEHIADLDPNDPQDADTAAQLERLFDETGVTVDDMTSGYALVSQTDFFSFVFAVRLHGAAPGTVLPAYLPILIANLIDPTIEEVRSGNKDVLVITSEGEEREPVRLTVYEVNDTVWLLQGPDDVVEFALGDLP
jgi:hypothetical protein